MSGMPALDKGPKANCHGTALLASSAGIRQTPPQRSSVASTRNLAQHQPAVRHWRSCKILQVPTHPASNKILRIATDVVIIRSRRLLMGSCRARSSCVYGVRGKSRGRGSELVRTELCRTPKGTYRPPEMDRSGPLLTATGPRERERERALYHFPSSRLLLRVHVPSSSRACVPSPVASTSINTTFWNMYDRVQASKSRLLHSRWSIDVGIESQTPFSPDSLRKTPLPCSPISPERSRVFPIAGRHPWTNHS